MNKAIYMNNNLLAAAIQPCPYLGSNFIKCNLEGENMRKVAWLQVVILFIHFSISKKILKVEVR